MEQPDIMCNGNVMTYDEKLNDEKTTDKFRL